MKLLPDPDPHKDFTAVGMIAVAATCAGMLVWSLLRTRSVLAGASTAVDLGLSIFFVVVSTWMLACAVKNARIARRRNSNDE